MLLCTSTLQSGASRTSPPTTRDKIVVCFPHKLLKNRLLNFPLYSLLQKYLHVETNCDSVTGYFVGGDVLDAPLCNVVVHCNIINFLFVLKYIKLSQVNIGSKHKVFTVTT